MTQRIVARFNPLVVGLFGSYAIGTAHAQSDLDLFMIRATPGQTGRDRIAVRRLLEGVMHPLDIHVFTAEGFEEEAAEALSFAWVIVRQARVTHAAPAARVLVASLFTQQGSQGAGMAQADLPPG
jgi:predicted nucleotidyltransferase